MQISLQIVSNAAGEINKKLKNYVLGLVLTLGSKNCASMARELFIQSTNYYSYLRMHPLLEYILKDLLTKMAAKIPSNGKSTSLIVDSTFIFKPFASLLQSIGYHFDGIAKRVNKGLCIVVIAYANGRNVVPIGFRFYIAKRNAGEDYRTKIEIAQELIREYYYKLNPDYICMDGGFMSANMIGFLESIKSKYSMRIPRNRLVIINGKLAKLSEHPKFRLIRNQRSLTEKGYYIGHKCFFTIPEA